MRNRISVKKLSPVIAVALAAGVGSQAFAGEAGNPFQVKVLPGGYQLAHQQEGSQMQDKHAPAPTGQEEAHQEDGHDHEKEAAEGKCGADHMKANEGKCGGAS